MWKALVIFFLLSAAAAEEPPKWNVEESFGPTSPLEFETDEGTWINLDVSPGGERRRPFYWQPVTGDRQLQ